jgi:hypothetical protein
VKTVASAAPGSPGSSVRAEASFVPSPSPSYRTVPWFDTTVPPAVAALTVAWMVTVTVAPLEMEPFQVTVFVAGVDTVAPLSNPVPEMVTVVPPLVDPLDALTAETVGVVAPAFGKTQTPTFPSR